MITLQNETFRLDIDEKGAEIHSLLNVKTDTQYIWNGNKAFWPRHTPLLFPMTGPNKDGKVASKGTVYSMPTNGFARDLNFTLVSHNDLSATFVLEESEQSRACYPFGFKLSITHTLNSEGYVSSASILAKEELWATFGWHPAFSLDMNGKGTRLEDYFVEFEQQETADRKYPSNGIFVTEPKFLDHQESLALSRVETDKGPIVLSGLASKTVTLRCKTGEHGVRVARGILPTLVLWTKEQTHAQFLCVEPMYSFGDASRPLDIEQMDGMMHFAGGEERTFTNAFTFF